MRVFGGRDSSGSLLLRSPRRLRSNLCILGVVTTVDGFTDVTLVNKNDENVSQTYDSLTRNLASSDPDSLATRDRYTSI